MKLHYAALRKDMFLYMGILYTHILKWGIFDGGGRDVVTAGLDEWGVRDRGSVPLVVPHSSLVILTVNVLLSVSDLLC